MPRKRSKQPEIATLPLFDNGSSGAYQPHAAGVTSDAASQALSVYWSAVLHAHALGAAIANARFPSERVALEGLLALELGRKDEARRLLREVWGLKFMGPPAAKTSRAA